MAVGWARDGAVQEQIDASVNDAVAQARQQMPKGESLSECMECGEPIPEARRKAIPGVRLCVPCQQAYESDPNSFNLYNRRGSKDSQLK